MDQATSRAEGAALANKHGPITTDDGLDKWVRLVSVPHSRLIL
jgi:hypothetical protein